MLETATVGQQMKSMPLHALPRKLWLLGTVNNVASGSMKGVRNADSGSRGTDGCMARSLNLSCAQGVVASAQRVLDAAHRRSSEPADQDSRLGRLTPRERDVLRLLVQGKTDQEIADVLFLSRRTITTHTSHLFAKLGVTNRVEATALAVREGLI